MRKIVLVASVFLLVSAASAQQEQSPETKRLLALQTKLEGTYQVQVINSREKIAFPLTTLDAVEARRSPHDTVYFWLKEHVRIMVLPASVISGKEFTPVQKTVYITE